MKSSTLKVPDATLYYEVRGAGPVLLIIPGGPQDAGVFAELARQFTGHYTVVTYDPRGNSRSRFDGVPVGLDMDVQGDDAAALLQAVGQGPAYVFGTSGGAQIGLNLAARHPALVRVLVAHEPPAIMLLDDPAAALAADQSIYDTYLRDGVDAAMTQFFALNAFGGSGQPDEGPPPSPEAAETFARVGGNFEYWLAHGLMALSLYRPDVGALRTGKPRIVVALGEGSTGQPIESAGLALARTLGTEPVALPGDHVGFVGKAAAFAEALHGAFGGERRMPGVDRSTT